jgi:hypothetical protein
MRRIPLLPEKCTSAARRDAQTIKFFALYAMYSRGPRVIRFLCCISLRSRFLSLPLGSVR